MDTSVPLPQTGQPETKPIAPLWHTIVIVVVLLGMSSLGANSQHKLSSHFGRIVMYSMTMAFEWVLVGFIAWGIRRNRTTRFRDLIGGRWSRFEDFLLDVAIAAGFWIVSALVLAGLGYALGLADKSRLDEAKRSLEFLVPRGRLETTLWIAVSCTAGFCEEVIFRGYLQRQLGLLLNVAWLGVVLQGMIFGGSHAYEGGRRMLLIAVYGILFGLLAYWRKSLRPGMAAHAGHDILAGLALRALK